MANIVEINEIELVDTYYSLELSSSYVSDPHRIRKSLADIFAWFGLKINSFNSASYNTIQSRYNRMVKKILSNKKARRDRHYDFIPDKLFFSESDFPELCTKKETATR